RHVDLDVEVAGAFVGLDALLAQPEPVARLGAFRDGGLDLLAVGVRHAALRAEHGLEGVERHGGVEVVALAAEARAFGHVERDVEVAAYARGAGLALPAQADLEAGADALRDGDADGRPV